MSINIMVKMVKQSGLKFLLSWLFREDVKYYNKLWWLLSIFEKGKKGED